MLSSLSWLIKLLGAVLFTLDLLETRQSYREEVWAGGYCSRVYVLRIFYVLSVLHASCINLFKSVALFFPLVTGKG